MDPGEAGLREATRVRTLPRARFNAVACGVVTV